MNLNARCGICGQPEKSWVGRVRKTYTPKQTRKNRGTNEKNAVVSLACCSTCLVKGRYGG
jgi:hypothetical protein